MGGNVVSNLCSLPATDLNFTSELNRATAYQIKQAIETMKQNGGKNKGRIKACDRELENRRLMKKDKHGKYVSKEHLSILCNTFSSEHRLKAILNKLGEYEDAERQGLLLQLPCKVGDTIYEVYYENRKYIIREHVVNQFVYISYREPRIEIYCERENGFLLSSITGKLDEGLFLTREEAEAKLKEMEGANVHECD